MCVCVCVGRGVFVSFVCLCRLCVCVVCVFVSFVCLKPFVENSHFVEGLPIVDGRIQYFIFVLFRKYLFTRAAY